MPPFLGLFFLGIKYIQAIKMARIDSFGRLLSPHKHQSLAADNVNEPPSPVVVGNDGCQGSHTDPVAH